SATFPSFTSKVLKSAEPTPGNTAGSFPSDMVSIFSKPAGLGIGPFCKAPLTIWESSMALKFRKNVVPSNGAQVLSRLVLVPAYQEGNYQQLSPLLL
ncbi:MAG: hypothetical protein WCN99_06000, partial [bacterium]